MKMTETNLVDFADEQLWQAFLYTQGELSAADEECFEQQLLTDIRLCELVVAVQSLMEESNSQSKMSMRVVRSELHIQDTEFHSQIRPANRSRRTLATLITLACCLMVSFFASRGTFMTPVDSVAAPEELLVNLWTGEGTWDRIPDSTSEFSDDVEYVDAPLEVPDWMLAGLTIESDGEPGDVDDILPEALDVF